MFACASVSHGKNHASELLLLPGYNYNYVNYSRNNFVDHGHRKTQQLTKKVQGSKLVHAK